MKNLFIALAIVFGICLQNAAAQTDTPLTANEKVKAEVAEKVKAELSKIDKELKLTADQRAQIKTILTEQIEKLEAVYKEIEPRTQAIKDESRARLRVVLTPEQQRDWDRTKRMEAEYGKKLDPLGEKK